MTFCLRSNDAFISDAKGVSFKTCAIWSLALLLDLRAKGVCYQASTDTKSQGKDNSIMDKSTNKSARISLL